MTTKELRDKLVKELERNFDVWVSASCHIFWLVQNKVTKKENIIEHILKLNSETSGIPDLKVELDQKKMSADLIKQDIYNVNFSSEKYGIKYRDKIRICI